MSKPPYFLQHLGLEGDADERAIRRSYARLLKSINQETEPQAFQTLREVYERALAWAQHGRQRAEVVVPHALPQAPERPAAAPVERVSGEADEAVAPPNKPADSEAMARAVLGELLERLKSNPPTDIREGRKLLDSTLDDPRLLDLDAQFLFEWGLASILAQGWKPGHEHLFGPAMACFKWREDRTRVRRLGHAARVIDGAIGEMEMYDSQPNAQRTPQRDLIRRLRSDRRPSDRMLIQCLPLAERLGATWPNWLHVVTNTQNVLQWRKWDAQVPRWRRAITGKPHGSVAKPRGGAAMAGKSAPQGKGGGNLAGGLLLVLAVLGGLGNLLSSNRPSTHYTQPAASFPTLNTGTTYGRLLPLGAPPALAPSVSAVPRLPMPEPLPPVASLDVAKRTAAVLSKGKPDARKCEDGAELLRYHASEHEKGSFGPAFDRLVLDCLVKNLWRPPVPLAAVDVSLKRNEKRTQALMHKQLLVLRTPLSSSSPPPSPAWALQNQPSAPQPRLAPPAAVPPGRLGNDSSIWLTPGSPLSNGLSPASP